MAGEFLRSHGVDIDSVMANIQTGAGADTSDSIDCIRNVSLCADDVTTTDVYIKDGLVDKILNHQADKAAHANSIDGLGALLAPSLCHPHIHLDKAYLLSHPKYSHLQIETGDFREAMKLTGQAKAQFEPDDLLQRGQRLIEESVAAGVTHMRAFVEVDAGVGNKCLEAGIALRKEAALARKCNVQICAFAQLPLFSHSQCDEDGAIIRNLMETAAGNREVGAIGSTPYVESDRSKMEKNVEWMIDLSMKFNLHLDFHLDYNLNISIEPLVWHVVKMLKERKWTEHTQGRTIVFGHCTRLTLFDDTQWRALAFEIFRAELPISFVGLPTSDLFMMRTGQSPEIRGTLNVPQLIDQYVLNACIGVNNIGNAFTPQGSCDPLSLACQGVGIYQAGTKQKAALLYACVSTRAKSAIGFEDGGVEEGHAADFVLFRGSNDPMLQWRTRKCVTEAVYLYDQCQGRRTFLDGRLVHSS